MNHTQVIYSANENGYVYQAEIRSTLDSENGRRFRLPISVQVNTNADGNDVFFSNYRLYLTAALYDSEGNLLDQPLNNPGAQVPIREDYITYTITRVLTDGYWGEP